MSSALFYIEMRLPDCDGGPAQMSEPPPASVLQVSIIYREVSQRMLIVKIIKMCFRTAAAGLDTGHRDCGTAARPQSVTANAEL